MNLYDFYESELSKAEEEERIEAIQKAEAELREKIERQRNEAEEEFEDTENLVKGYYMYKWYIINAFPEKLQKLISKNHKALLGAKNGNEQDDIVDSSITILADSNIPSLIAEKDDFIFLRERKTKLYFCDYLQSFIKRYNLGSGKMNKEYNQVLGEHIFVILQSTLKNYIDAYMTETRAFEVLDEIISQIQEEYGIKLNPEDIPGMDMPSVGQSK